MKCGAVGIKEDASGDNLKTRFSKHRSTYAKLVLLGAIKFKDSQTTTIFENWMKITLSDYSIDITDKGLIEQYKSTKGDTKEIIVSLILKQFSRMGGEIKGLGSLCNQNLIDRYNEVSNDRFR